MRIRVAWIPTGPLLFLIEVRVTTGLGAPIGTSFCQRKQTSFVVDDSWMRKGINIWRRDQSFQAIVSFLSSYFFLLQNSSQSIYFKYIGIVGITHLVWELSAVKGRAKEQTVLSPFVVVYSWSVPGMFTCLISKKRQSMVWQADMVTTGTTKQCHQKSGNFLLDSFLQLGDSQHPVSEL